MRLLLDMNIPVQIAEQLRTLGHDAVHVRERNGARMSDPAIFALAAAESRAVVTFDLDFGEIVGLATVPGCGVALLRLHRRSREHIAGRLVTALGQAADALAAGAIVVVEDARIRIRRMPPG